MSPYVELITGLVVVVFAYKWLASFISWKLRTTLTALDDIPFLGLPRNCGRKIRGTAVICGGSIAGLLSARICSDHFEHVLIIEPEAWVATEDGLRDHRREGFVKDSPAPKRSRVMQYTSAHVFQIFSVMVLRKLFRDFDHETRLVGGQFLAGDQSHYYSGMLIPAPYHLYPKGLPANLVLTRPAYESLLRKLVLSHCPNVRYITGIVTGLVPHDSRNSIEFVNVRMSVGDPKDKKFPATFVVDCTGIAMGGFQWLQDASFQVKPALTTQRELIPLHRLKTTYDPKMGYSTCEFHVPPALHDKIKDIVYPDDYENKEIIILCNPDPKLESKMFSMERRERDYLQILSGGWDYRQKITNISEIQDLFSNLSTERPLPGIVNKILDVLREEDRPATFVNVRIPPRSYVQYSHAVQLPSNFAAIGDSVMQLNPARGNGCTKACIEAVTLDALLRRTNTIPSSSSQQGDALPESFSRSFFSMQAKRTGLMWISHKLPDYNHTSTVPVPGEDLQTTTPWMRRYLTTLLRVATKDRRIAADLWHVDMFLRPMTDLLAPRTLMKVALAQFIHQFGL